jgi:hypothetical protein
MASSAGVEALPSAPGVQLVSRPDALIGYLDLWIIPNQFFARLTYMVPAALIERDTRPDPWFLAGPLGAALTLVGALAFAMSQRMSRPIIRPARSPCCGRRPRGSAAAVTRRRRRTSPATPTDRRIRWPATCATCAGSSACWTG